MLSGFKGIKLSQTQKMSQRPTIDSGTFNCLRDIEKPQRHLNVSGTLKCLRDIKLLCKYVQTCSWDKMYQGEMPQGQ